MNEVSFRDAVRTIKDMFPSFDEEVLSHLLRANGNVLERTIEQVLQMESDTSLGNSNTPERLNKSDISSKAASKVHTPAVQSEIGVYIDPMYPRASIGKRSAVRKDSQVLRMLSAPFESIDSGMHPGHYGDKADAALLATARCLLDLSVGQRNRRSCAVVKRPNRAATLGGELAKWRPSGRIEGSTHRYELYRL